jgi:putative NADH-flavin reductase
LKNLRDFCCGLLLFVLLMADTDAAEPGRHSLNILVYGASGKVGSHVVDEALSRGHRVTAVSRDPAKFSGSHQHLAVVRGDVLEPDSVAGLVSGQDVIIVSVRGIAGHSRDPADAVTRLAAGNVVDALRGTGNVTGRLLHVGGAGSLEIKPGVLLADRLPRLFMPKSLELEIEGQILTLEYLRGVSDVNWTYATPPRNFTRGKRTGKYRIGGDRLMEDQKGNSSISRADFAVALIDEAEKAAHVRQRFSVAY